MDDVTLMPLIKFQNFIYLFVKHVFLRNRSRVGLIRRPSEVADHFTDAFNKIMHRLTTKGGGKKSKQMLISIPPAIKQYFNEHKVSAK